MWRDVDADVRIGNTICEYVRANHLGWQWESFGWTVERKDWCGGGFSIDVVRIAESMVLVLYKYLELCAFLFVIE